MRLVHLAPVALVIAWLSGCASASAEVAALALLPSPGARLGDAALSETSGLTASASGPGVFWALNDSGNPARLHALDANGRALGSIGVNARNRDWEALESGIVDGVATLIIGETGDNRRRHERSALLLVAEPTLASSPPGAIDAESLPARRIAFRYEDGPRDVEAMSVSDGVVWLLDKPALAQGGARRASGIYRLELDGASEQADGIAVARRVGEFLAPAHGLIARLAASVAGVDLGYPTGLALDTARGHAWVLTYNDVLRYDRQGQESWADALARAPVRRVAHGLAQAEALALDDSGAVVFTSEGVSAPLVALPPQ